MLVHMAAVMVDTGTEVTVYVTVGFMVKVVNVRGPSVARRTRGSKASSALRQNKGKRWQLIVVRILELSMLMLA